MLLGGRRLLFLKTEDHKFWGLSFTALEAGSTVKFMVKAGTPPAVSLATSVDEGATWQPYTLGTTITLQSVLDRVCFAAAAGTTHTTFAKDKNNCHYFVMTGRIAASGDVSSMLKNDPFEARNLQLGNYCYQSLFDSCTAMETAPELPAQSLATSCYRSMFYGCTSLTAAPELPATTLAQYCYYYMFTACASLTAAPALPAQSLPQYCYQHMFLSCTALEASPEIAATTTAVNCCYSMFESCTSLTSACTPPATTLKQSCYANMFKGCSSLETVEAHFTDWNGSASSTQAWLQGVKANGTLVCPTALGTDGTIERGINRCPTTWTVVNSDA